MTRRDRAPLAALNTQLKLISWLRSEWGLEYLQHFKDAYGDKRYRNTNRETISHYEVDALNSAETYFVTREMTALISAAAKMMPADALHQSDLPCPKGFVYFEQPIELWEGMDPRDPAAKDSVQVRAICWRQQPIKARAEAGWDRTDMSGRDEPGVAFTVYVDRDTLAAFALRDSEEQVHPSIPSMVLYDISGWTFDSAWFHTPYDVTEEEARAGGTTPSISFFRTIMLAFFRLTFQKVAVPRREDFGRAAARQAIRAGLEVPQPGTINVVTLRRAYTPAKDGEHIPSPVNWTHRYIVQGFWRNHWYASLGRHQRIYIHPFIRGPLDKPLIIKDRIYNLER